MEKQLQRVRIRRAEERDAPGIARVHVDSWQAAYLGLLPASYLNGLTVAGQTARWRRILAGATRPGSRTLVLSVASEVVGFSTVGPTRDSDDDPRVVGEIYTVYVAPELWSHGLGAELFEAAQNDLAEGGHRVVTLWVLHGNARAKKFYEAAGFERDGTRRPVWMAGKTLPEIRYRRRL
jgi:ribosomal protein S18 acetylase RimI-like enzyme